MTRFVATLVFNEERSEAPVVVALEVEAIVEKGAAFIVVLKEVVKVEALQDIRMVQTSKVQIHLQAVR